jgi:hypothetical protein
MGLRVLEPFLVPLAITLICSLEVTHCFHVGAAANAFRRLFLLPIDGKSALAAS